MSDQSILKTQLRNYGDVEIHRVVDLNNPTEIELLDRLDNANAYFKEIKTALNKMADELEIPVHGDEDNLVEAVTQISEYLKERF
jgi:hypothetical protein